MQPITDVAELFRHQRAVRAFSDRDVDQDTVERLLTAATHGPSGSNTQPWRFIVVRDPEVKSQLSEVYEAAFAEAYAGQAPARAADRQPWTQVPVLIVACVRVPGTGRAGFQTGASIYPACQNLMLAARAEGIGSVLTTLHRVKKAQDPRGPRHPRGLGHRRDHPPRLAGSQLRPKPAPPDRRGHDARPLVGVIGRPRPSGGRLGSDR